MRTELYKHISEFLAAVGNPYITSVFQERKVVRTTTQIKKSNATQLRA
ncbi:MAG: hypothetical protein ACW968_04805 [Candidatus Thorarchaeota archaeon]